MSSLKRVLGNVLFGPAPTDSDLESLACDDRDWWPPLLRTELDENGHPKRPCRTEYEESNTNKPVEQRAA